MLSLEFFDEKFIEYIETKKTSLIEDQRKKQKFIMDLDINFSGCTHVYRLYEENDEKSKIKFLCYSEYPDGVFIKRLGERNYKVIVIELKRSAKNHLDKIPKQLHSGLLHAVSLIELSYTNIEGTDNIIGKDISITYELYVGSATKEPETTFNKIIPGILSVSHTRSTHYMNNEVIHHISSEKIIKFKITKIPFNKIENAESYEKYCASITI